MSAEPGAEFAFLRAALEAHLHALSDSGADALPPCDERTLEARRARYRDLARASANDPAVPAEAVPVEAVPVEAVPAEAVPAAPPFPSPPAAVSGDANSRLQLLQTEVQGCTRCALHTTRTQTVFARGTGRSGVCFIGEGPGADEDAEGLPFVGAAGQLLDRMIAGMGLTRDDVYVCNIVKCRPPKNRKPEREEMDACRPYLTEQIDLVAPRVIVALGATAVEGLLGVRGIQRLRGQWRLYRGQIPVMPTFHPAYLLREPSAKRLVWSDLKLVLEHLGLPVPERR